MSRAVAVIDYGMGNLHSVESALCKAGADHVVVTAERDQILSADRVVFPGVGAIRDCISEFRRLGCDETLASVIKAGTPVLGICVGMQSLMTHSEENGGVACLDWLQGPVDRFPYDHRDAAGVKLKVPHMGWNRVKQRSAHPMWNGIKDDAYFYFVHSFYVPLEKCASVVGTFDYGVEGAASVAHGNVFATQFHPEKSHDNGVQLLSNFLDWDGSC